MHTNPRLKKQVQASLTRHGLDAFNLQHDPIQYIAPGMNKAAEIIREAIDAGRTIRAIGHYDADAVMAALELYKIFETLSAPDFKVRLLRRDSEEYGISEQIINNLPQDCLLITFDIGIADYEAIKHAKSLGMTVIILDHHERRKDGLVPEADCIVDPHVFTNNTPEEFNDYCAAGLCYKLANVLSLPKNVIEQITVMAAIGTIADSVSVLGDNRNIIKEGLRLLNDKAFNLPWLSALCNELKLKRYPNFTDCITERDIAFKIAPAINAMGRMHKDGGNEILGYLHDFTKDKAQIIERIARCNQKRKDLSKTQEAMLFPLCDEFFKRFPDATCIVIHCNKFRDGIVGVLAAQVVEKYHRPAIVLTTAKNGKLTGSARSIADINIKESLDSVSAFIERYGGHARAAGLTLDPNNLEKFIVAINEEVPQIRHSTPDDHFDIEVEEKDIAALYTELRKYAPYGPGNPIPIVKVKACHVKRKYASCSGVNFFKKADGFSIEFALCKALSFRARPEITDLFEYHNLRKVDVIGILGCEYTAHFRTPVIYMRDIKVPGMR